MFLSIRQNAINPHFLELRRNRIKTLVASRPNIVHSPLPQFPPAALAVRAEGEVIVLAKINAVGSVIGVTPVSGHALLRATSLQNVKTWTFDQGEDNREVTITLVYLQSAPEKNGLKRSLDPYRPIIIPSQDQR